ncbi:hypothetical protein NE237_027774 [Protea cynaroides]|uniref:Uncharacterized protein n=1 Tax=Protea cynaroides TaxID=273540 RepID=A0A9Q0JTH7_9MAGN|nr:hypothetical protein NE237_027774 [Protea cynaroides]
MLDHIYSLSFVSKLCGGSPSTLRLIATGYGVITYSSAIGGLLPAALRIGTRLTKCHPYICNSLSLVELLLQNTKTTGRRLGRSAKRNISTLGNRNLDNKDPPETIGSGTSSEDEDRDQNQVKPFTPKMRVRTVVDQFQEALSYAAANNREILLTTSKQIGIGYYGRLLHVMKTDKERHSFGNSYRQESIHPLLFLKNKLIYDDKESIIDAAVWNDDLIQMQNQRREKKILTFVRSTLNRDLRLTVYSAMQYRCANCT